MNKPRFVLSRLKIFEIRKRTTIRIKLIEAVIAPIMVSQFFVEGGSLINRTVNLRKENPGLKSLLNITESCQKLIDKYQRFS